MSKYGYREVFKRVPSISRYRGSIVDKKKKAYYAHGFSMMRDREGLKI